MPIQELAYLLKIPRCYQSYGWFYLVSSNCNDGTSFLCGSSKCIPWSFVCDGIAECPDGGDEDGCEFPKTCQQWWDAGYHVSGIYKIRKLFISNSIFLDQ